MLARLKRKLGVWSKRPVTLTVYYLGVTQALKGLINNKQFWTIMLRSWF